MSDETVPTLWETPDYSLFFKPTLLRNNEDMVFFVTFKTLIDKGEMAQYRATIQKIGVVVLNGFFKGGGMKKSMRNGLGLVLSRMRILKVVCLSVLCLLATATTASAIPGPSGAVNINWTLSAGTYFDSDFSSILGPTGAGKSTIAQLMYSPDAVKDDIFPNGTGAVNDVVWDTITITETGDGISEYGVFETRNYQRSFTNGYVYALIFQDNNVQPGDWYLSGPTVALAEISGGMDPQSVDINTDLLNGDAIDGPYGARVVEGMVLTVNSGSGSGTYTNGRQVAISANTPATGQVFDRWTGATQYVNNVTYTNALVAMTTNPITLTATYKNLPGWYTLTVSNGSGSGVYSNGVQAAIAADAPASGKTFDRWIGATQYVESVTSATTTVTMPASNVAVTATYKDAYYTLTVNSGSGGGATYTNQQQVAITANVPAVGKEFDRWAGDTQYVASVTSSTSTVTMPASSVAVTATYKDVYYTLTITGGTGGGSFTNGTQAAITADAPAVGKEFDRWTGATQSVASVTSASTTVTMPAQNASLTATYKDAYYALTVNGGAGGGSFTNGTQVAIAANAPAVGKEFDRWTGATQSVASVTSASTTVTMPAQNASLTAIYRDAYYTLTVNSGSGSGATYTNQQQVAITANSPAIGKEFDRWAGDTQHVASVTSATTTVTMPVSNVAVTATYKDAYYTLTVTSGIGGGSFTNGTQVAIAADAPVAGKEFDRWTGATQYVASVTSPNTTVTIPATNIAVTATYKTVYVLSVNGGDGSGSYTNGTQVTIMATLPVGMIFDRWAGATQYVASVTSSPTIVTMPAENILITRIYRTGYYDLTVNGGTGSGSYTNGQQVKIVATVSKKGIIFVDWNDGDTNSSRIITMPAGPVTYTANLIDTQEPTVNITYPKKSHKIMTNGTIVIRGTAADNDSPGGVRYQLYTGEWTNAVTANGWADWTAEYSPVSGLNTARVYSVDIQGNVSSTSTVVFTYVPGEIMQVQFSGTGTGTIKPNYNGQVLEIGKSYKMTAKASKKYSSAFTNWTYGVGGPVASAESKITFVMQSNLVLTANFIDSSLPPPSDALADRAIDMPATAQAEIVVDGSVKDWSKIPCSSFSYASVTQEVAVALDGNNVALLLNGCPFDTSDNVLVYFKLRLSYGDADNRHAVDLWTSGSVLYGMVDGQVVAGLESVLLNGVLEIKLPVEKAPSQVTIEEIGCGMNLGGGTLTELFKVLSP